MTPQELRARLMRFATEVGIFANPLFDKPDTRSAADQLVRAATSASANYRAAGHGRSHAEFTSKLSVALEEADESAHWLEWLRATRHVSAEAVDPILHEATELTKILGAARRTALNNEAPRPRRPR
jgi:four helix bundle protein